ncbi:expressed unknown protein [Seminavis robusta]|uniref:Uncharacterized protein n=1 Tax=Seminavis robusta TaxID=568900 RepID=A0A9N8DJA1_9STRA|nr:expressed unknown protein [Seminavis robusta]|eukprot:Sro158_g071640.1 n/a (323) ;mRNA; f:68017-68985
MARTKHSLPARRKFLEASLPKAENGEEAEEAVPTVHLTRWVLIFLGIVIGGAFALFTRDGTTSILVGNLGGTVKTKGSNVTNTNQTKKPIDILALPLPSIEPFDMSQYEAIHLWHLRKAGGTTLRIYFENIAKHHNVSFKVEEGYCYRGILEERTLVVTMLKDPVARIVSEYWGEGSINLTNPDTSFMDWVEFINTTAPPKLIGQDHWFSWSCVQNCMARLFGNHFPANLTKAKHALEHDFDLIVQSNRMSDPNYTTWLSHVLGAPEVKMPHRGHSDKKYKQENQVAAPKEEDLQVIRKHNQLDYDLLEYLLEKRKDLVGVL